MEQTSLDRWRVPLKVPAVEVIDLLSEDELFDQVLKDKNRLKERDASEKDKQEEEDDSEGSQSSLWEDILNAEEDDEPLRDSTIFDLSNAIACKRLHISR